jgi:hypothetical protein
VAPLLLQSPRRKTASSRRAGDETFRNSTVTLIEDVRPSTIC